MKGALFVALIAALASAPAGGQTFPSRPIQILVGAAAGGGTGLVAGMLTQPLAEHGHGTIVVDNCAGGAAAYPGAVPGPLRRGDRQVGQVHRNIRAQARLTPCSEEDTPWTP